MELDCLEFYSGISLVEVCRKKRRKKIPRTRNYMSQMIIHTLSQILILICGILKYGPWCVLYCRVLLFCSLHWYSDMFIQYCCERCFNNSEPQYKLKPKSRMVSDKWIHFKVWNKKMRALHVFLMLLFGVCACPHNSMDSIFPLFLFWKERRTQATLREASILYCYAIFFTTDFF